MTELRLTSHIGCECKAVIWWKLETVCSSDAEKVQTKPRTCENENGIIGVNLAKILGQPESEHLGLRYNRAHSRRPCWGIGMGGKWIGFGVRFCPDSLEWRMKIVGYEKAEFSEICKRK